LLPSCSNIDFQDNKQVAIFLSKKALDFDGVGDNPNGGKIYFNIDGTFTMRSVNTNDPTQNYRGTWTLGECRDCTTDYLQRDISLEFKNTGWVTDGYTQNETPVTGYGTFLKGYICKDYHDAWNITFALEKPQSGFIINNDGTVNGDTRTEFKRDLLNK
jgi:hypothetical protein